MPDDNKEHFKAAGISRQKQIKAVVRKRYNGEYPALCAIQLCTVELRHCLFPRRVSQQLIPRPPRKCHAMHDGKGKMASVFTDNVVLSRLFLSSISSEKPF